MSVYEQLERETAQARDHTRLWDRLTPLGGMNGSVADEVAAFCERKRITLEALLALEPRVRVNRHGRIELAFAGYNDAGRVTAIKYRPVGGSSHDIIAEKPSVWLRPPIVGHVDALEWFVAEGETDAARLLGLLPPGAAVLVLPAGALTFKREWADRIPRGATVYLCHDADESGDKGAEKAARILGSRTIRVRPPVEGTDWCDWDGDGTGFVELVREVRAGSEAGGRERLLRGGAFILDHPTDVAAVWRGAAGLGTAWAVGEGLMIVGPDGVGKTTVIQQVSLGRIGLRDRVLGMRLEDDGRPLLYLALDRPAQIARSFARMVSETDRETLDRRLIIWKGPPPFDITKDPRALADFAEEHGAGTVVVDSLKDLASKLSDDEVGGKVNAAFQHVLARGIELLCGHHQRKAQAGAGAPKRLADVYGSRWLTAGMGSVFMLWGDAGDLEVECLHLKQPDEELGPWKLLHDHGAGKTVIVDQVDLLELVAVRGSDGLTAEQGAALLFDTATPARNEVEKARRRLGKLVDQGFLTRSGAAPDPVIYLRSPA